MSTATHDPAELELHAIMGELEGASNAALSGAADAGGSDGIHHMQANVERWTSAQQRLQRLIDEETELDSYTIGKAEEVNEELRALIDDWNNNRREPAVIANRIKRVQSSTAEETIRDSIMHQIGDVEFGKFIDFKLSYGTAFPDPRMRARLLTHLDSHAVDLPIVVDVQRERVYKLSPSRTLRVFSYFAPAIAWIVALGLLGLISRINGLPAQWNLDDFNHTLMPAFVFLSIGVIGHLLVEHVKQKQIQIAPVLPLSDTLDWLHLRWVGIMQTVMFAFVSVVGLSIAGMEMKVSAAAGFSGTQVLRWIAAGYALDSVAGILLTRFGVAAGKQVETISESLTVGAEQ